MLSRSIIIRSTKLTVICTISCFSRDSSTRMTTKVNDTAPDKAGRRRRVSQAKFRHPQLSTKHNRDPNSVSVSCIRLSAARCGTAIAKRRQNPMGARPAPALAKGAGVGGTDVGVGDTAFTRTTPGSVPKP